MSYEDTQCPCGGTKLNKTLLCCECEVAFAQRPELAAFKNEELSPPLRRQAALILLVLARGRKRNRR
jgi:hypothetical protein